MTLLAPWNLVIAASIAIPALLLIYMLRLRRRRMRMSSTLLWTGSVRDLEGNVPFQRVRPSWMFFLQLLALLLLLLAMGEPVLTDAAAPSMRTVIAIDTSASMSIRGGADQPTRFERAVAEAERRARSALVPGSGREVMLVALGVRPQLLLGFDQHFAPVRAALRELKPTDEALDPTGSIRFVQSLLRGSEASGQVEVLVLSDGSFAPLHAEAARISGKVRLLDMSDRAERPVNLGIVGIGARRDPREPQRVTVIVTLASDSAEQVETIVELLVDGRVVATRAARVGGGRQEIVQRFELDAPGPATIVARHRYPDALAADDEAQIVLERPRRPAVAIVHAGAQPDPWLRRLLEDIDPEELRIIAAPGDEPAEVPADRAEAFDLVVFDRVAPRAWPAAPLLIVDAGGPDLERRERDGEGARRILAWDRAHPLLRHAVLDDLAFTSRAQTIAPADARVLATDAGGAAIFTVRRSGAEHVVLNFSPAQSTWPADVSFAIFGRNLLDLVVTDGYGALGRFARAGETIELMAEGDRIELLGPAPRSARAQAGQITQVPVPSRVGVYEVVGARGTQWLAVNLLDRRETMSPPARQEPQAEAGSVVDQSSQGAERSGRPIRRWLLLAALFVLIAEWMLYLRINRF